MSGTASGVVLGFLLATAYGAAFHLLVGGPARRIALYLVASWVGFIAGQLVGGIFGIDLLKLGTINLLSASIGAWLALFASWWLARAASER